MHLARVALAVLSTTLALGCGGADPAGDADAAVDAPPAFLAPPPAGAGLQVTLPSFTVAPGEEVYWCVTMPFPAGGQVDVARIESRFNLGAHHMLLSTIDGNHAAGNGRCGAGDFGYGVSLVQAFTGNLRFLSGAQTPYSTDPRADLVLDPGMAFRFRPGTTLLAQLHWANTTEAPIDAATAINFWYATTPPSRLLEAFFFYHQGFRIPAHASAEVAGRCTFPRDVEIIGMVSHMHARGTLLTARRWSGALGETVYQEASWQEPQMKMWPGTAPLTVAAGAGLEYRCAFTNDGDTPIVEGEGAGDEMCMLIGLYAGGDRTVFGFPGASGVPQNPCVAVP